MLIDLFLMAVVVIVNLTSTQELSLRVIWFVVHAFAAVNIIKINANAQHSRNAIRRIFCASKIFFLVFNIPLKIPLCKIYTYHLYNQKNSRSCKASTILVYLLCNTRIICNMFVYPMIFYSLHYQFCLRIA